MHGTLSLKQRILHSLLSAGLLVAGLSFGAQSVWAQFGNQVDAQQTYQHIRDAIDGRWIETHVPMLDALEHRLEWLSLLSTELPADMILPERLEAARLEARARVTLSLIDMAGQISTPAVSRLIFDYIAHCCSALWLHEAFENLGGLNWGNTRTQVELFAQEVATQAAQSLPSTAPEIPDFPDNLSPHQERLSVLAQRVIAQLRSVVELHDDIRVWREGGAFADLRYWLLEDPARGPILAENIALIFFPLDADSGKRNIMAHYLRSLWLLHPMQEALVALEESDPRAREIDLARAVITLELIQLGAFARADDLQVMVLHVLALLNGSYHWVHLALAHAYELAPEMHYRVRSLATAQSEPMRIAAGAQLDGHERAYPIEAVNLSGDRYLGAEGRSRRNAMLEKALRIANRLRGDRPVRGSRVETVSHQAAELRRQNAVLFGKVFAALALQREALASQIEEIQSVTNPDIRQLRVLESQVLEIVNLTQRLIIQVVPVFFRNGRPMNINEFAMLAGLTPQMRDRLRAFAASSRVETSEVAVILDLQAANVAKAHRPALPETYAGYAKPHLMQAALAAAAPGSTAHQLGTILHQLSQQTGLAYSQLLTGQVIRLPPAAARR